MAIPFSQRVKLLPEPKANKTELVAKAHEEYPYLLTYQVPENNILGKWFGKQTTVKLLIKSDKKVPEMAQKIKHNDDYHYSLETVAVANNRSQTKITDSRKYLRHKINDLQADLTSQRRHVKILNCYRNSQDSLTVKRFGDVN